MKETCKVIPDATCIFLHILTISFPNTEILTTKPSFEFVKGPKFVPDISAKRVMSARNDRETLAPFSEPKPYVKSEKTRITNSQRMPIYVSHRYSLYFSRLK